MAKKNDTVQITPEQEELRKTIDYSDVDWQTITEDSLTDFSMSMEPYPLPEEAKKKVLKREFAFRWIEDSPARLKEIMKAEVPDKWWPCNRTNTPFLSKHCDNIDGAVHCKDQILVFKPWWMHFKRQEFFERQSEINLASGSIDAKNGFKEENGTEWHSGQQNRITSSDEVMGEIP
jgi:hypothetical protein